jgi:hypothetical protein
MNGKTQDDYAGMMLGGGRSVDGNCSRSGMNKPAPLIGSGKTPPAKKAKTNAKAKPPAAKPK